MDNYLLNDKQFNQLYSLCKEFQPIAPFEEVVFLRFITLMRGNCIGNGYGTVCRQYIEITAHRVAEDVLHFRKKYYFQGFKQGERVLSKSQFNEVDTYTPRIYIPMFSRWDKYRPIEKIVFMKLVHICRDFMRTGMSDSALPSFIESLIEINYILEQ